MFMNKEYQNYKIKVEKLQQQVWKSEMQRKELEYKFEQLMRDRNQCEKSAIKSIKTKYKKFMEEDEERTNRNSTLMKMLERIDYQAATLAAKTERLKLLKAQHELYLMKTWNIPCPITQQLPHPSRLQTYSHQSYEKLQSMAPSTTFNTLRAEQPQSQQQQQSQSIYPSSFTPHECETNLKSDFVKYLSNINQFPGIAHHEKNNFVDNTLSMLSQQQQPPPLPSSYSQHIYRYPMTNENLLQTTSSYDDGGNTTTRANFPNENWNSYSRTANKYDGSIINLSDKPLAIPPTNTQAYGNLYNENCIIEDDNQLYGGHSKKNQQNMPFVSSTMQQYLQQQRQPPNIQIVPPTSSSSTIAGGGYSSPTYLSHTNQDIYRNVQNQQQQHLLNSSTPTTTSTTIQSEAANLNIKASATDIQKNSQHYPTTPTTTTNINDGFDSRNIGVGVVGDGTNNSNNNIEYGVHRTQNINENNSSAAGIQMTKDINSRSIAAAAVSISNTSVNAGTINTNGNNNNINAMHQNENYISAAEKLTTNDGSNAIVRHDLAEKVIAPFVTNTIPNIQRDANNTSQAIVNQQIENITNRNKNDNYGDKIDYSLQKEISNKNDNEENIIEKHENDDEKTEKSGKNIIKLNENANGTMIQENVSNDIIGQEQSMDNQKKIYYEPIQQTNPNTHDNNLVHNEDTKSTIQQYQQQQQQLPPTTIHHQEPHQIETNEANLNGNLYETDIQHSYNNQSDAIISNQSVDDGTYGVDGNYPEGINYDNVNEQQQPLYTTTEDNNQYEITNQDGQQYDDTNQLVEQQQYENYNYEDGGQYFGNEMNNSTVDYTSTVQQDSSNIVDGTYVEQDYNSSVAVDGNQLLNADGQTIASYQDPTQTDVYQQNDQLENVVNYPEDIYAQQNVYQDDQTYADYQYQVEPGQEQYNPEMYAGYENAPQDNQQLDPNQYSTVDNNNNYSQEPGENYYADESQQQYLNEDGTTIAASGDLQQQQQEYIENDQNISNLNVQQDIVDYNNMPIDNGNLNAPETDNSSTTYSENVNIVPQPILNSVNINDQQQQQQIIIDAQHPAAANKALLNQQKATKNFLDSETDDSSTVMPSPATAAATTLSADVQQVKQISNDESDFDFSAN